MICGAPIATTMSTPPTPIPTTTTTPLPPSDLPASRPAVTAAASSSALPAWLREPVLHFVVLGAALFALDHYAAGQEDDPRTIVVAKGVADEAKALFRKSRDRDPNEAELRALTERWIDNEVLYREGLALQVDQGDTMIRERVIFKSLMVVEAGVKLPPVDDTTLRAWFETQRAKYDEPARYDFQEAVLSGDSSEAAVRALALTLNTGAPGDVQAGLRIFKGRPHSNLVQSYGDDFAKALNEAPPGEWRAMPTREGLRLMRLDQIIPAKPADFEALRNGVLADWTDATLAQQRTDAVRERAKKYTIKFEGDKT